MATHVMLDLETMGNNPDAAICEIGACSWDSKTHEVQQFQCLVSLETSVAAGGKLDVSTVLWWMQQEPEARVRLTNPQACRLPVFDLASALALFAKWIKQFPAHELEVWGNGVAADNVWLRQAYVRTHQAPPWSFRQDRCYRTLKNLLPHILPSPTRRGEHQALADALYQLDHLIRLLAALPASPEEGDCQ